MGPFDSVLEFKCVRDVSIKTTDESPQVIEIKHNLNLGKTGKLRLTVYDEEGNIVPVNHTDTFDSQTETSNTAKISIDRSSVGLSLHISGETLY